MAVLIDIVGASVIAGIIMLTILNLNANLNQASYEKVYTLNMQTNIVTLARIIEYDFVKIGYHTSKPAILNADSTSIRFTSDLLNAGVTNTVKYSISDVSESVVASTKNPRDRMIYREVNGQPMISANLGVTSLKFTYLDSMGSETSNLTFIKAIRVKIKLENPEPIDTTYQGVFWEKTIYPRNL